MKLLRWLRTLHGWMGVVLLPWVVLIGLTGFYLNHPDPFLYVLENPEPDDAAFPALAPPAIVDRAYIESFAARIWPSEKIEAVREEAYHNEPSLIAKTALREIIAEKRSGYVYEKTDYVRHAFKPDGEMFHTKYYWGRMFKEFHVRGWLGTGAGTFLADLVSLCLVVFGLSGMYIFFWPRIRRATARNRG
jgi:hypothetical protein